jgi:hypothetical protein
MLPDQAKAQLHSSRIILHSCLLQDTLEVFVETPEAAAPTKKLKKGLSKVFGRKDSDSDGEAESVDAASGVGETEEALDGHLFSVGVAFAQASRLQPCVSYCPVLLCRM